MYQSSDAILAFVCFHVSRARLHTQLHFHPHHHSAPRNVLLPFPLPPPPARQPDTAPSAEATIVLDRNRTVYDNRPAVFRQFREFVPRVIDGVRVHFTVGAGVCPDGVGRGWASEFVPPGV